MAALTFRDYTATLILSILGLALVINFTGGIINVYGSDADSKTLQKIQNQTEVNQPDIANLRNRTQTVDVDDTSFLSPQGFNIVSDLLGGISSLPSIFATGIAELGFPKELLLIASIPVAAIIFETLSLLFGIRT